MSKIAKRAIIKLTMLILPVLIAFLLVGLFSLSGRDRGVLFGRESSFDWDGEERKFLVSKPTRVSKSSRLIVGLHGFNDSPRRFAYYTGLHNVVGDGDIVVYPKASVPTAKQQRPGWNAGFCCGSGWVNKVDDVGFIVELARSIAKDNDVDPKRIYLTGFSNGAMMVQRVASERPEVFKAVAARSGSIGTTKKHLKPTEPVNVLLSHGSKDDTVPISGGARPANPDFAWLPYTETLSAWKSAAKGTASVKELINDNDKHVWHDWRIYNFWHRYPGGSQDVINFFDEF